MSGHPQFNHPLFHEVAATLRLKYPDVTIINPAELDSPQMQALALQSVDGAPLPLTEACGETWGDVLARDVRILSDEATGIVLLPDWDTSRGAKLELTVAMICEKDVFHWTGSKVERERDRLSLRHDLCVSL
jgi:hypothetical protein